MSRWLTADLRLGRADITEHTSRPFNNVDWMNRAPLDRWDIPLVAPLSG